MARPRNEELYNKIKTEAYRQLVTKGYADTTYQSIATECGVTRTAVQNYFPSKQDLAFAYFGELLGVINDVLAEKALHQENEFDVIFSIGQSFFYYLLRDAGRRKLIYDQAASRDLTGSVLEFEYEWGLEFIQAEMTSTEVKFRDDVFFSMGGFYELLYQYIKYEMEFDFQEPLGKVIIAIMRDHGYHYEEAKAFVQAHHMTKEELEDMASAIAAAMQY